MVNERLVAATAATATAATAAGRPHQTTSLATHRVGAGWWKNWIFAK